MNVEWHKYPDTKPTKYGCYLITYLGNTTHVEYTTDRDGEELFWDSEAQEPLGLDDTDITAWMELPEPYEE